MLSSVVRRVSRSNLGTKSLFLAQQSPNGPSSFTKFAAATIVKTRGYHENIVEHYENPRNVGSFDKNDNSVGTVSCIYLC